jgi:hypothetical protein
MAPPDISASNLSAPAIGASARPILARPLALSSAQAWLAAASLPWLVLWLLPPINHDVAGLLLFTERWLSGDGLYTDLIDVNPPLVFILYAIPVALARWTGLGAGVAFLLCLLGFVAVVVGMAWRRLPRPLSGPQAAMLAGLAPLAVFGFGAGMDGQREQLLVLASLPWLLDAAARAEGRLPARRSVPAALLAALFICLKPHFAAMALLVELWLLLLRRSWRGLADPVPWAMAAVFAAYGAVVLLLFPAYPGTVLPFVLEVYSAFGDTTWQDVLFGRDFAAPLLVLAACVPFAFVSPSPVPRALALAAIGAVFGAVAQAKGWPYHRLPAEMLILLLAGWLGAAWLERLGSAALAAAPRFALAALVGATAYAVATREAPWRAWSHPHGPVAELARVLHQHAAGKFALALTPGVDPVYPALFEAGAFQAMRYMTLWPLQVVYEKCPADGSRFRPPERMRGYERTVFRQVTEDFVRRRPAVVLLDRFADIEPCGEEFDFLLYFLQNPAFAEEFSHYAKIGEVDRFAIFTRLD